MKIVTSFIKPPIPRRNHDWEAHDADLDRDMDGEGPTGYGETEADALMDLIPELVEHYQMIAYAEGRKDQSEEHEAEAKERRHEAERLFKDFSKHGSM